MVAALHLLGVVIWCALAIMHLIEPGDTPTWLIVGGFALVALNHLARAVDGA